MEHQTPPQAIRLTCLKTEDCDVALLGFDPARLVDVDYSPAIIEPDYPFLVPAGSTIHGLADLDRPGMRVAVVRNHASTMTLTCMLKQATFVYGESLDSTFELLRAGKAAAFASIREMLV